MSLKVSQLSVAVHHIVSHIVFTLVVSPFFQVVSMGREKFVTRFQLVFRILKGIVFLVLIGLLVLLFVGFDLTIADVGASILAFIPTGWFILLVRDFLILHLLLFFVAMCNSILIGYMIPCSCTSYLTYSPVVRFMLMPHSVAPCRLHN